MTSGNDERLGHEETPKRGRGRPRGSSFEGDEHDPEGDNDGRDYSGGKSDDEYLTLFRETSQNGVLPDLPRMPGYHLCWLTTTNPRDSIQWRVSVGYELIRPDMLPGFDGVTIQTGDYSGVIGVNEMVAARIPLSLYNRFMREAHHDRPLAEESKLRSMVDNLKDRAASAKSGVIEEEGMASLSQRAAPMKPFQF